MQLMEDWELKILPKIKLKKFITINKYNILLFFIMSKLTNNDSKSEFILIINKKDKTLSLRNIIDLKDLSDKLNNKDILAFKGKEKDLEKLFNFIESNFQLIKKDQEKKGQWMVSGDSLDYSDDEPQDDEDKN
jgi:hypothetical protein